jgi:signal peptidase
MANGADFLGLTSRAADLSMFQELSLGSAAARETLAAPFPDCAETPEELANAFGTSVASPVGTTATGTAEDVEHEAPEEGATAQASEEVHLGTNLVVPVARHRHVLTRKGVRVAEAVFLTVVGLFAALLLVLSAGPRFLPFEDLVVQSGSMTPTLPVGSVAIYRHETAAQVKVGQIILFGKPSDPSVVVTHRVYAIKNGPQGRYFKTKGDANPAPDAWQVRAVGSGWYVAADIPLVGYALHVVQLPITKRLLIIVPAVLLGLLTLYDIARRRSRRRSRTPDANANAAASQAATAALVSLNQVYAAADGAAGTASQGSEAVEEVGTQANL